MIDLTQYVFHKSHLRANGEVKPDAFIPYSRIELSVTNITRLAEPEIWEYGHATEKQRNDGKSLVARADITSDIIPPPLTLSESPLDWNLYHMDIVGWPNARAEQALHARVLAGEATVHRK